MVVLYIINISLKDRNFFFLLMKWTISIESLTIVIEFQQKRRNRFVKYYCYKIL